MSKFAHTPMSKFAHTPMHGAAYAVAIGTVGGMNAIGACSTREIYADLKAKLDELQAFADTQDLQVRAAYSWGIQCVDNDMKARLEIFENSRAVAAALEGLPQPKKEGGQ